MRKACLVALTIALLGVLAVPAHAYSGAFLSFPRQACTTSVTGNNVEVGNKSWQGCTGKVALTVHDVTGSLYLHDLDFADSGGGIFIINCTCSLRINNIRARNIGDGTIGSGHGNVIQFNNVWQTAPKDPKGIAAVRFVKAYGGDTEDMISVYKSGGIDAQHPLVLGAIHLESPLPPDPLAWSSNSGTGVNLADSSGHDIVLQNSSVLSPAQVGEQINHCSRCTIRNTVVYGSQRSGSNVGISRYGSCTCSGNKIINNRIYWINAAGHQNSLYIGASDTTVSGNVTGDTTIDPNKLHVIL